MLKKLDTNVVFVVDGVNYAMVALDDQLSFDDLVRWAAEHKMTVTLALRSAIEGAVCA